MRQISLIACLLQKIALDHFVLIQEAAFRRHGPISTDRSPQQLYKKVEAQKNV